MTSHRPYISSKFRCHTARKMALHRTDIYSKCRLSTNQADDITQRTRLQQTSSSHHLHIYIKCRIHTAWRMAHAAHSSSANVVFTLLGDWPYTAHTSPAKVVFTLVSRMAPHRLTSSNNLSSSHTRMSSGLSPSQYIVPSH